LVACVALALLALLGVSMRDASRELEAGGPAPDFRLRTFDGSELSLSDMRGKVVVLNFWASWCAECAIEAPALEAIWRDFKDRDVVVIGVGYMDTEPAARAYLERFGITYPNGADAAGAISKLYRLTGVPETVVIGRDGNLVALDGASGSPVKLVGALDERGSLSESGLRALLERLLDA
jgi:cytochrome c biogenesis protein CcmG/thiol:disulfide interchange protein DsbE